MDRLSKKSVNSSAGKAISKKKIPEFSQSVLAVVKQIPAGRVVSYKEVAEKAGRPRAYRAVGNILSKNIDPAVPCHRVIRSDGKTGGYNRGPERKRILLSRESGA